MTGVLATSKSCLSCLHKAVCKIYHGELLVRGYKGTNFKEIQELREELGSTCSEYLSKEIKEDVRI